ncbi:MAG TPA: four helix bundle protein [Terriglobia bacterium]|nr:four helix bundle protein [Terriglobia bacterium]
MKDEIKPEPPPVDIRKRSFQYALRALKLCRYLAGQRDGSSSMLAKQYVRAATSIGANLQEALSGESRADFIHKYAVAQKEARESLYWLELMAESGLVPRSRLDPLIRETNELVAIITKIIVKSKRSKISGATAD